MKNIIPLIFLLVSLVGCQLGPKYQIPLTPTPEEWKNPYVEENVLPDVCNWWEVFQEETLNDLENQAVANNPDLFYAMARIDEALAVAGITRADLYPQLNFGPNFDYFNLRPTTTFSKNIQKEFPSLAKLPKHNHFEPFFYDLPLLVNYEVDLWGKYRNAYDAALRNVEAQRQAYLTALLTLTSELANSYFNARTLDTVIDYLEGILETRRKNLKLSQSRFEKGLINYITVTNDQVSLTNTEADYYEAVELRGLQENMIAALIGIPASDFYLAHMPLKDPPPVIPAGIPSTVLLRRPDIAQAERTMASENALIGVAFASFFPSLDLTGAFGFFSLDLQHFFKFMARYWDVGASSDQTIFDGLRKYENYEASWARFREADSNYKKQVLTAFKEVEDALNKLEFQTKQSNSLKMSFEVSGQTTKLARQRFDEGLVNYIEVVDDERLELNAGLEYYTVLGLRYQSTIQLIKALGGGW